MITQLKRTDTILIQAEIKKPSVGLTNGFLFSKMMISD